MSESRQEETFSEFFNEVRKDLNRSGVLSKEFVSEVLGWLNHTAYLIGRKTQTREKVELVTRIVKGQFTLEFCICSDTASGHQINCPWLHLKMGTRWAEYMRTYGPEALREGIKK